MTSKRSQECYVFITLPGETESVTAGRFVLRHDKNGNSLGQFVYGRSYLSRPGRIEIDPVELLLAESKFETLQHNGVFGALRDSGPDFWGRRIIEKHAQKVNLSEVDYLLESPDDRAGALGFGLNKTPPSPKRKFNQTVHLSKLIKAAENLIADEIIDQDSDISQLKDLLLIRTSMGGARPKAVVEDDNGLWLAKFNRPDDRWNSNRVEHAMLELARQCGINSALSRIENVAGKDVLLVKRFDRERSSAGYLRARMISALTSLNADDSIQSRASWSYVLFAEQLRKIVAEPKKDVAELFRRMCFNALISNIDDHPRNHALIATENSWRLSPAYDLTPSPAVSIERRDLAMTCGDLGRFANAENLVSQHARFLLEKSEAAKVVKEMTAQVRQSWYSTVRACAVSEKDANTIKPAFGYPGFDSTKALSAE